MDYNWKLFLMLSFVEILSAFFPPFLLQVAWASRLFGGILRSVSSVRLIDKLHAVSTNGKTKRKRTDRGACLCENTKAEVFMGTFDDCSWHELIKRVRIYQGWSQSEAAGYLGVDERTLRDWEAGRHFPNYAGLRALRRCFGKSLYDDLLLKRP